ncbi:MAG TPA: TolC family protein [Polyangia bacterium]|nr:TolC family protein [Polyangia bacterium]
MWRRRYLLSVLAVLLSTSSADAEEAPPSPLPSFSLPEALAYARAHQPSIRAALARWTVRQTVQQGANARWYPRVGVGIEYLLGTTNNNTASVINAIPVETARIAGTPFSASTNWSPTPSNLAAVRIEQQVYDFGRTAAQAVVSDSLANEARAEADIVQLETAFAVEEAYHGVLAAKDVLRAAEGAVGRARLNRDYALASVKAGLLAPVDRSRAEAEVARLEAQLVRAQAGLDLARAVLAAAIGLDHGLVDARPLAEEDANATPSLDLAVQQAMERNPAVIRALGRLQTQAAETQALSREFLPNIRAVGSLYGMAGGAAPERGERARGGGLLPSVGNWYVALTLQWEVYDEVLRNRRRVSQAESDARRAELDAVRQMVGLEVERVLLDLRAGRAALPSLELAVKAARDHQMQAQARFRAGIGTSIELTDAEALLIEAEVQLAAGRFAVARAQVALGRALGRMPVERTSP